MASWQSRLLCLIFRLTVKRAGRKGIDIAGTRAKMGTPRARVLRIPPDGTVSRVEAEGLTFERVERAGSRADLVVLYLHGGGYFFGSPQTHRQLTLAVAEQTRAPVFALDYRLAPEHRYPAALNDAVAAYRWLSLTQPGRRIVLAGDSAGGGLALATAGAIRDLGMPNPAALVCFSPWTDLAATGMSIETNARRCAMFTGDGIRAAARLYLGDTDAHDPRASPLYADMAGLPPMQIFVGDDELLRDDSIRLAEKTRAQGVVTELHVVAGVPHVWPLFARLLPEGRESLAQVGRFIERTV